MKKRFIVGVLAIVLILALAGCSCKHEWLAATCTAPKTCSLCEKTEGEPLGHTWQDATCTAAKTCSVCKTTEGEPLAHTWQDATCTAPKTCSVCSTTDGDPLGHTWQDATCDTPKTCTVCAAAEGEPLAHDWQEATTEAPQTCSLCGLTEGEKLVVDPRFTTASTKHLHGTWTSEFNMSSEMMGLEGGFENGIDCIYFLSFSKTGEMKMWLEVKDEAAFLADYKAFVLQLTYDAFLQEGLDKEAADQAVLEAYGVTMEEYVDAMLKSVDVAAFFEALSVNGVYYVQDDQIYNALLWTSQDFESAGYTLKDGVLTIEGFSLEDGGDPIPFTKAAE